MPRTAAKPVKPITKKPAQPRRGRPTGSTGKHSTKKSRGGVLQPGETLQIQAFMERLGISYTQLRSMIDRGLKVRKDGKYRVVRAVDYDEYLSHLPTVTPRQSTDSQPSPPVDQSVST